MNRLISTVGGRFSGGKHQAASLAPAQAPRKN